MVETVKTPQAPKQPRCRTGKGLIWATIILVIILAGLLIFQLDLFGTTQDAQAKEVARVLRSVSAHIMLPDGQEPAILTVENPEELAKDQQFFAGASKGDKLIIYPNRAILYNPTKDILINVGPVYFNPDTKAAQ